MPDPCSFYWRLLLLFYYTSPSCVYRTFFPHIDTGRADRRDKPPPGLCCPTLGRIPRRAIQNTPFYPGWSTACHCLYPPCGNSPQLFSAASLYIPGLYRFIHVSSDNCRYGLLIFRAAFRLFPVDLQHGWHHSLCNRATLYHLSCEFLRLGSIPFYDDLWIGIDGPSLQDRASSARAGARKPWFYQWDKGDIWNGMEIDYADGGGYGPASIRCSVVLDFHTSIVYKGRIFIDLHRDNVSLFTVAGTISGLIAGHLSDRIGYKPIFYLAHSLTTPSLYLLLYLPGNWVYFSVSLAGLFAMATLPLGVAMAQEMAPKGRSMVSSLMMGFAFGLGGIMIPLTGKLAEIFSIRGVLVFLAIIPLLTTGLISLLPEKKSGGDPNL